MSTHDANASAQGRRGDSDVYWSALKEGAMLLPQCNHCGEVFFHPRPFCPFCMSDDTTWIKACGKGRVYSFTVTARAPIFKVPAMVTLDEGPTLMTAIIHENPDDIAVGQTVALDFMTMEDGAVLPIFRLS